MSHLKYSNVLALGVFDLFHVGHLHYLQYAKSLGRKLIVGVATDSISLETKSKFPIISEYQRLDIVRGLNAVDEVRFLPTSTERTVKAAEWIPSWKVDLVVVGEQWKGSERWNSLTPLLELQGIEVTFAPHTQSISSSQIISKIRTEI